MSTPWLAFPDELGVRSRGGTPCKNPSSPATTLVRCRQHTVHRYWLEVALPHADPRGPNVVVVAANPTCPDEAALHNTTFARVRALGDELGAASLGMVNVASRRTHDLNRLAALPAHERVGSRHVAMLEAAFAQADLAVLAPGTKVERMLPAETARVEDLLRAETCRGLVVVRPVGIPAHPMRWPTARLGNGSSTLVQHLCRWPD